MRGGMAHYIMEVNNFIDNRGHTIISMFSEQIKGPKNGRLRRYLAPFYLPQSVNSLPDNEKPDVVEIHEPFGAWYVRERRRNPSMPPVVISVYGLESRALESRIATEKWLGRPVGFFSKLGAKSVVWQANYALKHADHVIVEATEDKEWVINHLKRTPESITIQTGGVNPIFFANQQEHNSGIIFLGSWIERKGITVFSRVVTKLFEEGLDLRITIAGTGCPTGQVLDHFPETYKNRINVVSKINSDKETAKLLSQSGIFFFPSNFEGVPLSLIEAAAAGCAILTSEICGMKDFIQDGVNGLLCRNLNENKFYERLKHLLFNKEARVKFGFNAREYARNYTWERSAEQFLNACSLAKAALS
jgi:glycosyltransferase involved in cell wall biosynthesis